MRVEHLSNEHIFPSLSERKRHHDLPGKKWSWQRKSAKKSFLRPFTIGLQKRAVSEQFENHKNFALQLQGETRRIIARFLAGIFASSQIFMAFPSTGSPLVPVQDPSTRVLERFAIPTDFPALKDIAEIPIKERILSNGLKVFLIEDHEVPLVKATLAVRGGQRASPANKVGLASLSASVLRSGGSKSHPSSELDNELEELAAGIEGFALPEALILGFEALKEDVPRVMSLFCEILQEPQLPDDKISLFKNQVINALEHRNDSQRSIPIRELSKLIYGAESVYARQPTIEQVGSIQREDVQKFLNTWLLPEGAILGVLGDFESEAMEKLLDEKIGKWKPLESGNLPEFPSSPIPDRINHEGQLYLVDFPGSTQASLAMGELGVELSDPDTPSLDVLNEILNSFGGILFNEIRSKEGLAYSVAGGFNTAAIAHPGLFVAMAETASVQELIQSLERVLQDLTKEAPSQAILEAAKNRTLNSFVFNFSSSEAQLQRLLGYKLVGLPQDYLFQYRDKIQAVSAEDVLRAARKHLHPNQQDIVVVADSALNLQQLQKQSRKIVPLELS